MKPIDAETQKKIDAIADEWKDGITDEMFEDILQKASVDFGVPVDFLRGKGDT